MTGRNVAVVIPAYNEGPGLRELVERALAVLPTVVVVDDGSADDPSATLAGTGATILVNDANRGKGYALMRGIAHARAQGAEGIVTLDGDGQHRPEEIPRLVAAWEKEPTRIVVGARLRQQEKAPRARLFANRFANFWIAWAAGFPIADSQSGFRLYPAELFDTLAVDASPGRGFVFESELLIEAGWQGRRVRSVPIDSIYEPGRRHSHFRPVADIAAITRMVAGRLLRRGMHLPGLWRSLTGRPK